MASEHPTTASRPIRVRRATIEDKDRWVITHNSGYELDRQFTWRYPKRKEYQEDSINSCVRVFVEQLLPNTENDNIVPTVAEIKKETEGSNEPEWKVIGIAVWERKLWEDVEKEASELALRQSLY